MIVNRIIILGFMVTIYSCAQSDSDSAGESEESTSESGVAGALAILTINSDDEVKNSQNNLVVVTADGSSQPLSTALQIETDDSTASLKSAADGSYVDDFTARTTVVNPYRGDLVIVLAGPLEDEKNFSSDCQALVVDADTNAMSCMTTKPILEHYDHEPKGEDSTPISLHFSENKIFYLSGDGSANPTVRSFDGTTDVEVIDNEDHILGMATTPRGVVFYWGSVDNGTDERFLKYLDRNGQKQSVTLTDSDGTISTKMLFLAADQFGGLVYVPEMDARSEHHVYKLALNSDDEITQTLQMTTSDTGSILAWPIAARFDSEGRVFMLANRSTEVAPGQEDENAEAQIYHLFMFTLAQEGGSFSSEVAELTDNTEDVSAFAFADGSVYYHGIPRGGGSPFVRKRGFDGSDAVTVSGIDAEIKSIKPSLNNKLMMQWCDGGGTCDFGTIDTAKDDEAKRFKDNGDVVSVSPARPPKPAAVSSTE